VLEQAACDNESVVDQAIREGRDLTTEEINAQPDHQTVIATILARIKNGTY
jgi:hypothetical protein